MRSSTSNSEEVRLARGVPWGLAFGLVFFALTESALWSHGPLLETVARYTPASPDGDPLRTAAAVRRLSKEATDRPRIVFLGSSQVREGVDCEAVDAALGGGERCANLAVGAGSPLDMLTVVNRLGPRGGRRVTVLGIFPKVLHMPPKTGFTSFATLPSLLRGGAWASMTGEEWRDLSYGLLQSVSPTLRFKDGLELAWRATGGGWRKAWRGELPPQQGRLMAGSPPCPPDYFEKLLGVVDDEEFARASAFARAQEGALQTLAEKEIACGNRIIVVDFPTRTGYVTTVPPPALRFYEAACERIRRWPGVVFVDQRQLGPLSEADFLDFTHLNRGGRAKVSGRLAYLVRSLEETMPLPK